MGIDALASDGAIAIHSVSDIINDWLNASIIKPKIQKTKKRPWRSCKNNFAIYKRR
jgi:hypothetical protein